MRVHFHNKDDRAKGLFALCSVLMYVAFFIYQRLNLKKFYKSIRSVRTEDDAKFSIFLYKDFMQIARVAMPSWRCKEFWGSLLFISLFAVKAWCGVLLAQASGGVLEAMTRGPHEKRLEAFVRKLAFRCSVGLANSGTSSAIEYLRPLLIASYRKRLTQYFQRRFYDHLVYYQGSVLDNRLEHADTTISLFSGEFAEHFAELPYYFILPAMEGMASLTMLTRLIGWGTSLRLCAVVAGCVAGMRWLTPPFGKIHTVLLSEEENFRRLHSNNLNNVEDIALHSAGAFTLHNLEKQLGQLNTVLNNLALAKGHAELLDRTFATVLNTIAYVVAFSNKKTKGRGGRRGINDVYVELQHIQGLNQGVKDFVTNFRELSHLTEYTTKLAVFDRTLQSIANGTFIQRASVPSEEDRVIHYSEKKVIHSLSHETLSGLGTFPLIKLENLTVKTPVGAELFTKLNLTINNNEDWAIVGDNGRGKTSLLRVIAGLWVAESGNISIDKGVKLLFAPQHSYMAAQCSLMEQITFPTVVPPEGLGEKEFELAKEAIRLAGAESVVEVVGGWHSPFICGGRSDPTQGFRYVEFYDWNSLSGGQKQRVSMARVFYHTLTADRTKEIPLAVLDESTSMMDESEEMIFAHLKRLDVRMISVTHRRSVLKHHNKVLHVIGDKWLQEDIRLFMDSSHSPTI